MTLPPLVVGTSSLGSVVPDALASSRAREETFAYLDRVVEAGCCAFDLAASYRAGGTERLFGAWMASRRNRDALVLVGKGCHPLPLVEPRRLTARALEEDLHGSLRRLRVERIDLDLLHRDDPRAPLEPIVGALRRAYDAGKIGAWGVSNFDLERLRAVAGAAERAGLPKPAASSPHLSLFEWVRPPFTGCVSVAGDAGRAARAFHAASKLPVLAWQPLGAGFVAGRAPKAYASDANRARLRRAERLARARDATPAQVALAFLFRQPFPVHPVVASRSVENLRRDLAAADLPLSPEDLRWLGSGDGPAPAGVVAA